MPSVSNAQHNAMEAAAHSHSTLGIPASVGKEFVAADAFDESKHPRAADGRFGSGSGSSSVEHESKANEGKYTEGEKFLIANYNQSAKLYNHFLVNGFSDDPDEAAEEREGIDKFQGVIDKASLPSDTILYRGLKGSASSIFGGEPKVGDDFTHKGFMSTSTEEGIANRFSDDVVLKIEAPKGTHALFLPKESEAVLSHSIKFKIAKVEDYYGKKMVSLQMKPTTKADSIDASGHEHGADGKFTGEGAGYTPKTTKILRQTGKQLGSNPGGQYHDMLGNKFYVKASKSAEHAANEILAGHLYKAAGAPITQAHAIEHEGKPGTISHWAEHDKEKFDPDSEDDRFEARDHFATHAWLGNWDAIGLDYDNQVPIGGKLHTVDAGGAMKFRAQGTPKGDKLWGPEVHELKSMRDPSLAPQAAKVFGNISESHLKQSAERVKNVPGKVIEQLCQEHGYGSVGDRMKTADLLIARKHDLLKKTGHL